MDIKHRLWAQNVCERKKRAFDRKAQAVKFARRCSGRYGVYKCPRCHLWHLFSKKDG